MIKLVKDCILKDTPFLSNLKSSLIAEHFDKLRFYTEDDIKHFGKMLQFKVTSLFTDAPDEKKELDLNYLESSKQVNEFLIASIDSLIEYLNDSESYINASYVKEEASKSNPQFKLSVEQKTLSDPEFDKLVSLSFKQELANFLLERADYFQKMTHDDCVRAINQSTHYHHQVAVRKEREAATSIPKPTEKRSTEYPIDLINKVGGEERFQQLLQLLATDKPFYQEVKEVNGGIHCKISDEENILWNVVTEIEQRSIIKITATNAVPLTSTFPIGTNKASIAFSSSIIPSGAYQYSLATLQDILTTRFKEVATLAMLQLNLSLNNVSLEVSEALINGMMNSGVISRQAMIPYIESIVPLIDELQAVVSAAQQQILGANGIVIDRDVVVEEVGSEEEVNEEEVAQNSSDRVDNPQPQPPVVTAFRQQRSQTRSSAVASTADVELETPATQEAKRRRRK